MSDDGYGELAELYPLVKDRKFEGETEGFKRAKAAGKRFREEFTKLGKLKYERVLGFGGFGMVQLWSLLDDDGRATGRSVAVKLPTRGGSRKHADTTRWEMHYMGLVFRNLDHFVQLVDVEKNTPEAQRLTNNNAVAQPVLVMEALQKCNLFELISWINESREAYVQVQDEGRMDFPFFMNCKLGYVPNRVMWKFFWCLLKGVVGMAYPNEGNAGLPSVDGTSVREMIPPEDPDRTRPEPSTIIHFDLDPQNVLVGDLDISEHRHIPKLKARSLLVADFGLTLRWRNRWNDHIKTSRIERGKPTWYAPEQRNPMRATDPHYHIGWELNVWAIGLTMFNLLTLSHPVPNEDWFPQPRVVQSPRGDIVVETYGWFLIQPPPPNPAMAPDPTIYMERYDFTLRSLIARCMADDTNDRPDFHEIWTACMLGIAETDTRKNFNQENAALLSVGGDHYDPMIVPEVESDEIVHKFYQDYFVNPPARADPYAGRWSDQ
ncbi:kinase-like domain-containing protein [Annulohypoxylon truncatum]|uniref:kinase-like domain-containing protein n=1 Tax=Annulohypoxylon truncatum TaxID=327061 RepID=UPI0020088A8D|nr:kinase-like domain-containing protein [Annulohypoxylon truncatum]KAI1209203.1 kinase-like domain-containing protein [Annulohypoxylon truncatum]